MVDTISRNRNNEPAAIYKGVSIGGIHNPNTRKNVYVVYAKFMHGDADGYQTEEADFVLGDEEHMIDYLNFLARCSKAYPHGKGGCDDFSHIPGYTKWVESYEFDEELTEEEIDDLCENQVLCWPHQEGYCASYESTSVVFFNETGIRHEVKLIKA